MHPVLSEGLVSALECRFSLDEGKTSHRAEVLSYFLGVDLPAVPNDFTEKLPQREFAVIRNDDEYSILSPRRLLHPQSPTGQLRPLLLERLATLFGGHSSNLLVSTLHQDPELVNLLCRSPLYPLLCKVETYTSLQHGDHLYVRTQPLLVIPDCTRQDLVEQWEHNHTIYEEERRFLFPFRRSISPAVYRHRV